MAAAASVPVRQLDDVTECPICVEEMTDARVLPCIHTFCLKCLQGYAKNTRPGEQRTCPLCRQVFTVPEGNLAKLPRNYFVEKVLEVKSMAAKLQYRTEIFCDLCKEETEGKRKARVFCVDCKQNMCKECNRYHQKFKDANLHTVTELDECHSAEQLLQKLPVNHCDLHTHKQPELYCFQCKVAVCMMCYMESHKKHKCSNLETFAQEANDIAEADIANLKSKETEWRKLLAKVTQDRDNFEACATKCETEINHRVLHLKEVIDYYGHQLLDKLRLAKQNQKHRTETMKDEIKKQSMALKNFIRYMSELKQKGTASYLAKLASSLHTRADELCKIEVEKSAGYRTTDVDFKSTSDDKKIGRVFGDLKIDVSGDFPASGKVQVLQTIRCSCVYGMSTIDNEIYVLCSVAPHLPPSVSMPNVVSGRRVVPYSRPNSLQIYIYDSSTLRKRRSLSLSLELGQITGAVLDQITTFPMLGFAACSSNKCLYLSDQGKCAVQKMPVTADANVISIPLPVCYKPFGLSTNSAHDVLVTCRDQHLIMEMTTNGSHLRQITLMQTDIESPLHAVQLSSGLYGVLHHGSTSGYSVVDTNGKVVKRYGQTADCPLKTPRALAVVSPREVVIIDEDSNKLLILVENQKSFTAEIVNHSVDANLINFNRAVCISILLKGDSISQIAALAKFSALKLKDKIFDDRFVLGFLSDYNLCPGPD